MPVFGSYKLKCAFYIRLPFGSVQVSMIHSLGIAYASPFMFGLLIDPVQVLFGPQFVELKAKLNSCGCHRVTSVIILFTFNRDLFTGPLLNLSAPALCEIGLRICVSVAKIIWL